MKHIMIVLLRGLHSLLVNACRAWLALLGIFLLLANPAWAADSTNHFSLNFDSGPMRGWRVDATHPSAALAEWRIVVDPQAPSPPKVLTIQRIHDDSRGVFNLYWTRQTRFQDGELELRVRANSGRIDQGGGLIWRAQDANNYYIARYNPLENNFRLYFVKDGRRTQLATLEGLGVRTNEWFHLRIRHEGSRIQGWLNGAPAWKVTDNQLPNAGGVGLWTKADAASSFDDFLIRPLN
jgi:hypothetical protein